MSEQGTLFEQEAIQDPAVIYKFGTTHHYEVLDRFTDDPILKEYDVEVISSQWLEAEEASDVEDEYCQRYSKSLYNFKFTLFEGKQVGGQSEMRYIDDAIMNKIKYDFYKIKRVKRGWDEKSKELRKVYSNYDLNANSDPDARYQYHCYKFYIVVLLRKNSRGAEEYRKIMQERKQKWQEAKALAAK